MFVQLKNEKKTKIIKIMCMCMCLYTICIMHRTSTIVVCI